MASSRIESKRATDSGRSWSSTNGDESTRSASVDWWSDPEEVLSLARVLVAHGGSFTSLVDLLYFFEKPWKWTSEREVWIAAGRPEGEGLPDDMFEGAGGA